MKTWWNLDTVQPRHASERERERECKHTLNRASYVRKRSWTDIERVVSNAVADGHKPHPQLHIGYELWI